MADDRQFGIAIRILLATVCGLGVLAVAGLLVSAYDPSIPTSPFLVLLFVFLAFLFSIPLLVLFIWVAVSFPRSISRHPVVWSVAGAVISILFGSFLYGAPSLDRTGAVVALLVAGPAALFFSISMISWHENNLLWDAKATLPNQRSPHRN